jgi:hypothetical protein
VRIVSRETVPAELGLARDFRSLGVAVRWIEVRQGTKTTRVEADDARLAEGFHAYEADGDLRWTDGDGVLPVGLLGEGGGDVDVVIYLGGLTRYPMLARAA